MTRFTFVAAALGVAVAGCAPPPTGGAEGRNSRFQERMLGEWVVIDVNGDPLSQGFDDLLLFRSDDSGRMGSTRFGYRVVEEGTIEWRYGGEAAARDPGSREVRVAIDGDVMTLNWRGAAGEPERRIRAARYGSADAKSAVAGRRARVYLATSAGFVPGRVMPAPAVRGPITAAGRLLQTGGAGPAPRP